MNILITMGMNDSLIRTLVGPITQLDKVKRISIVRNQPGPDLPKVRYYCPPPFIARFSITATLAKFFLLVHLSIWTRPDLIHSFLLFPSGILAFLAAALTGKKTGITLNAGQVELYGIGGSPLGVDFTKPLPWSGKIFLWMLRHSSVIAVINGPTRDFLVSHEVDKNKIHVIPQPIDTEKHKPSQEEKKWDVISVGRLAPVKHVEVFLEIIALLKQSKPSIKACIVGNGPSGADLENLAGELGITENVEFAGFRSNTHDYYNASKLFVLNSEREGGPLTFTEAMACGIPPIASNCGIVSDVGKDGLNCVIIEDHADVQAFADAILRILDDDALYNEMSANAVKAARSITYEDVIAVWETIIESIRKK